MSETTLVDAHRHGVHHPDDDHRLRDGPRRRHHGQDLVRRPRVPHGRGSPARRARVGAVQRGARLARRPRHHADGARGAAHVPRRARGAAGRDRRRRARRRQRVPRVSRRMRPASSTRSSGGLLPVAGRRSSCAGPRRRPSRTCASRASAPRARAPGAQGDRPAGAPDVRARGRAPAAGPASPAARDRRRGVGAAERSPPPDQRRRRRGRRPRRSRASTGASSAGSRCWPAPRGCSGTSPRRCAPRWRCRCGRPSRPAAPSDAVASRREPPWSV